jgi:hypothetical protein
LSRFSLYIMLLALVQWIFSHLLRITAAGACRNLPHHLILTFWLASVMAQWTRLFQKSLHLNNFVKIHS